MQTVLDRAARDNLRVVTRPIAIRVTCHGHIHVSCVCVTCLMHMCDMLWDRAARDNLHIVTRLIDMRVSCLIHMCVPCLIHMCDISHSYVCHVSL